MKEFQAVVGRLDVTKYMTWTNTIFTIGSFLAVIGKSGQRYDFEKVERFRYLGVIFTTTPGCNAEVQARREARTVWVVLS